MESEEMNENLPSTEILEQLEKPPVKTVSIGVGTTWNRGIVLFSLTLLWLSSLAPILMITASLCNLIHLST
jgi:hypothetical protein